MQNKAVESDLLKDTKELKNHQLKLIELDSVAKDRIEPIYTMLSPRIPYDIASL
jgi:hypothetical protein